MHDPAAREINALLGITNGGTQMGFPRLIARVALDTRNFQKLTRF
ncbi:MAG: hypothetical protein Q7T86_14150 [Hyphomicrobiaceae bacterium]|nr:hypothetical protein [Hyphomicrobiaceae bacterium]